MGMKDLREGVDPRGASMLGPATSVALATVARGYQPRTSGP